MKFNYNNGANVLPIPATLYGVLITTNGIVTFNSAYHDLSQANRQAAAQANGSVVVGSIGAGVPQAEPVFNCTIGGYEKSIPISTVAPYTVYGAITTDKNLLAVGFATQKQAAGYAALNNAPYVIASVNAGTISMS